MSKLRSNIRVVHRFRGGLLLVVAAIAGGGNAQTVSPESPPPYELWRINADGSGLAKFAETPGYTCGSPDWSPDGKLVAYDTWRVDQTFSDSQVAVIRADGTDLRLIGPGAMPSWSPDGTQLVCHTYESPQTIVVMNADGSGRETIINHWGSPRWSPRGNRIASIDTDRQILAFDLSTGIERYVLPPKYAGNYHYVSQVGFGISPDGSRLCFGDSGGLFMAMLDDGAKRAGFRWLVKGGVARHCSWSPDGKRIVFAWKEQFSKVEQLFVIDVDSGEAPTRLAGQYPKRNNSCPDWSPDGRTIVFASQEPSPSRIEPSP